MVDDDSGLPRPAVVCDAARRALLAERAQLLRWQRLVRARLDLVVAAWVPPDAPGTYAWHLLPGVFATGPTGARLAAAVTVPEGDDPVDLLRTLRELDRALTGACRAVDALLDGTDDHLLGAAVLGSGPATRAVEVADPVRLRQDGRTAPLAGE